MSTPKMKRMLRELRGHRLKMSDQKQHETALKRAARRRKERGKT